MRLAPPASAVRSPDVPCTASPALQSLSLPPACRRTPLRANVAKTDLAEIHQNPSSSESPRQSQNPAASTNRYEIPRGLPRDSLPERHISCPRSRPFHTTSLHPTSPVAFRASTGSPQRPVVSHQATFPCLPLAART